MDFCLRGSQISLVARQKPKPKYCSQTNLNTAGNGGSTISAKFRPRSAPFISRRARSSPFLYRPQSADVRLERSSSSAGSHNSNANYWQEQELPSAGVKYNRHNKRFLSVSSSNLLKLLLDEPIKRSWLCRSGSSPDDQSELSSAASRKTSSYSSLQNPRLRTESAGGSSIEGDIPPQRYTTNTTPRSTSEKRRFSASSSNCSSKMFTGSSSSALNMNKEKFVRQTSATDFWPMPSGQEESSNNSMFKSSYQAKSSKPDLPGRVSFSKPHSHHDIDSSDCDNDKQEAYTTHTINDESISAPGPVKLPIQHNFSTSINKTESMPPGNSILKKSVHFGAGGGGGEVLAETFEYPKCPSENCSCSTRSSSTASIHDMLDGKCACESSTCKYSTESSGLGSSISELDYDRLPVDQTKPKSPNKTSTTSSPLEDLAVIRDYKNAVGPQLENSIVKSLLKTTQKDDILPDYLQKYTNEMSEKQNNLSETKNGDQQFKSNNSKCNFFGELSKTENNLSTSKMAATVSYTSSSESVINNYLKVTRSTNFANKKKENKPNTAEGTTNTSKRTKSEKPLLQKTKSAENGTACSDTWKNMKKATSFHNLREDSNLDAFNLDKVDSWMSMHEQAMGKPKISKHGSMHARKESSSLLDAAATDGLEAEEDQLDSNSQISSKTDENSQDDSTYEEIVSVIKEIEEDKKKDNLAEVAVNEMELKLNTTSDIAESSQMASVRTETSDSQDKYKDILNYLDNVEDSCDKALLETRRSMPESNRSEIEFVVEPDIVEDVPKLADLLVLPNHQLARRVVALSLRANELNNALHMSKEHVSKLKVESQKTVRAEKANTTNRLKEQKKHYESVVQRHQGFIEQLLKDKGSLCEKVAALTRRLESQNQAWEHKLETEVNKVRETTLAGEKIRRERWVRENTKKIKELTVKGLEMEINKMTAKHQQEITELKRTHQQQLLDALEEARLKHEQIENSIRESTVQDRESIIEKERGAIRERFERQLDEERKSFDEQKQKLLDEFAMERERLQRELKTKDIEHQAKRHELQREQQNELEQTIAELQDKMSKQDEKYQNRINTIEKQYESDFEIWKREYENTCKLSQVEKENNIRQHYRAERDRQIDAIVSRMDAEALKNAEEYEAKLSRFKEKHEKDLADAECLERSLREKYTEIRGKLAESDAQVRNYQAELKQLQIELEHSKKMCNDFLAERDQLRDNLRNEMQNEVATLKNERDHEIQKIHKRVQQAIEKKDITIDILQKETGDLRERCIKLEAIIRQQRKDYCIK